MAHEVITQCPHCGTRHEAATNVTGSARPSPGDFTLCFNCGEWCVVSAGLGLEKPTDDELIELAKYDRVRAAWKEVAAGVGFEPT